MSIEKVRAFFAGRGREKDILEFDVSSATVELAAQAVGCEAARIAKTLSFAVGEGCVLVVCAGDTKIDNTKFKAQFIPDLPISHHWVVGMDVQDIVIQYLMRFFILI